MKLDLKLSSSVDMSTKEEFAQMLRQVADAVEQSPFDRMELVLTDPANIRVGHLSLTGAPTSSNASVH